ncbi:MAG: thermonuclease family protein [Metamycoplasmataceae bacterium]
MPNKIKKYFKSFFLLISIPTFLFMQTSCIYIESNQNIFVKKVYDGDTFYDKQNNSYRVIGINTPEIIENDQNFFRKKYAYEAKRLLSNVILEKEIKTIYWKKDYYKRNLVEIYIKNTNIAAYILKNGLARIEYISDNKNDYYYYPNSNYLKEIEKEQNYAKINKIGIWKENKEKIIFSRD